MSLVDDMDLAVITRDRLRRYADIFPPGVSETVRHLTPVAP